MKKKILSIVLIACMVFSFTACGDTGNSSSDSDSKPNESLSSMKDSSSNESSETIKDTSEGEKVVDSKIDKNDSSPLEKVKQGVNDVKEIVSDVKEIKDSLNSGKIATPMKAKKCKGENYEKIKESFENAGFTDITVKGNGELKVGLLHKEGEVEYISINGDDSFGKGDKFPEDAKVVISYYSKE